MTFKQVLILSLSYLWFFGCSGGQPKLPEKEELPFTKVPNTEGFQLPTSGFFMMNDPADYQAFVDEYWQGTTPAPEIDFHQRTLIAIFYGAHYSGCQNEVDVIRRVTILFNHLIAEVNPLPDLGVCATQVMPHQFVTIPKQEGFISFIGTSFGDVPRLEPQVIDFEILPNAEKFHVAEPGIRVFRDEAAWLELWESSWTESDANGLTPPPEVDFSQHMVLAVFYGEGFSGCRSQVEVIASVEESCPIVCDFNDLIVRLNPLPDDLGNCREAIAPLQMIVLPQSDLEIVPSGPIPD